MNSKIMFCIAVLVGFHIQARCSTNITLAAGTGVSGVTNSFTVATGRVAKVTSVFMNVNASLNVTVGGAVFNYASILDSNLKLPIVVVGPAKISLPTPNIGQAFCTIEVSNPADSVVPSTAVVIPSDSGGPVNIILESSSDLINWFPSLPGAYGANYTNRFFRVRAQLTQ